MLTVFIALFAGAAIYWLAVDTVGEILAIVFALLTALVAQVGISLLVRRKIMVINNRVQRVMMDGQEAINRRVQVFQRKPPGGVKTMQAILEKEQAETLRAAMREIAAMEPYQKWNVLLYKQIATMRLQFNYQLREFDEVDRLLPRALYLDATTVAMKMARQHKNNDPKLEATFKSKVKKFRGDDAALLYGLYSWILVKRGDPATAIKILAEGKETTDNETLRRNWEHLANDRVKKFSNADFGDKWYSLYLEEPKIKAQRQKQPRMHR